MVEVVRPFSQIFKLFFRAIRAPIVALPSENFENCSIGWKGLFFGKKRCKYHLNRPKNADSMSFGSNPSRTKAVDGRLALFSKTRNKSNDYFESMPYRQDLFALPITTRENTSLAIQVVQKITIIRAQKIGKFEVWNLILRIPVSYTHLTLPTIYSV